MKYLTALLLLSACSFTQKPSERPQGFTISAQVSRNSVDDQKGFQIVVFPLDNGPQPYYPEAK